MSLTAAGFHFLRNVEIYLTLAGLAVIFAVPMLFAREQWMTAVGVTAVLVGVVHGLLFWLIRRRQRLVRAALVSDLQMMLKDRINNKLQVVLVSAVSRDSVFNSEDQARLQQVSDAVQDVTQLLDRLSLESLSAWQKHYSFKPTAP